MLKLALTVSLHFKNVEEQEIKDIEGINMELIINPEIPSIETMTKGLIYFLSIRYFSVQVDTELRNCVIIIIITKIKICILELVSCDVPCSVLKK